MVGMSIGSKVRLAIETECTAMKAGNVHPGASFQDLNYGHFLAAAKAIGERIDSCMGESVGQIVLQSVTAMMTEVGTNTSLGTILLVAPLVVAKKRMIDDSNRTSNLHDALKETLVAMTAEDSRDIYEAIRIAKPGGLGDSKSMDVRDEAPQDIHAAMRFAAEWDDVALQYVSDFELVFEISKRLKSNHLAEMTKLDSIRCLQIELLSERVDSLIARKQGLDFAKYVQARAAEVAAAGPFACSNYEQAWQVFDAELRDSQHRGNPGTIADLIAAGVLVWQLKAA